MHSIFHRGLAFIAIAGLSSITSQPAPAARPTNVVFILTDNQGAWTLGCYGNPDIRTPHIDQLATQGIRFTRALSSNPVCSPTRATFLSGLIPSQHGVHCFLDPKYMIGPEAYNTLDEFDTLGEILKKAGYRCGLSGKWHLGANMTPSEGFDDLWVTKPDGSTKEFTDQLIIENGEVHEVAEYTTSYFTRRGVEFIEKNKDQPFFLFLAYNGPYALGPLLLHESPNRHAEYYADKDLLCFPRDRMHPWQFNNLDYHNNPVSMRRVAAEVSGVDDGVGEIMQTLDRLHLTENTLVIYTSDQGWMGGQNGIWGMGDHTRPFGAHDLMMQIPLIFSQPGSISPDQTCDALVSNYDFLPSVLGYLGLAKDMPTSPPSPGRDFSPALHGQPLSWTADNAVFYEFENTRCMRGEKWKIVERHPSGPHELYDMEADPQERFNLFGQPGYEEAQAAAQKRLHAFFDRYADPKYDVWKGGGSKATLLSSREPRKK
ncbi:MAG: sulfatase-like hydrolase/transferase [Verrucomicrobiales bacterium]|nr:sulfatase-like hydrolase/transferase [Verrucomicrobiales bacterium]